MFFVKHLVQVLERYNPKHLLVYIYSNEKQGVFSMVNIKTINHSMLMLDRYFNVFGNYQPSDKNQKKVKKLILLGIMAATYLTNYW